MPALKLKQLEYEIDTWKRLLSFMMEENIHLKNRLSDIIRSIFDKILLEEIENFQSRFIKQDELIRLLRNDVAELDELMLGEIFKDGKIKNEINRKLGTLGNNITIAETQFNKLKLAFTDYLSKILNETNRKKCRN